MVGSHNVVINRLGYAHYPHLIIMSLRVSGKLCYGIHRIVTAYVKEISDIVFLEEGENLLVDCLFLLRHIFKSRKLLAARAKSSGGSLFEGNELRLVLEHL